VASFVGEARPVKFVTAGSLSFPLAPVCLAPFRLNVSQVGFHQLHHQTSSRVIKTFQNIIKNHQRSYSRLALKRTDKKHYFPKGKARNQLFMKQPK
jgi:hypothetical protein